MSIKTSNFILFTLPFLLSCRLFENVPPNKPTDPREYTWTLDTLDFPDVMQLLMRDMWASSAKDIYLAGHSSSEGTMIHFDGSSWKSVKLHSTQGGPITNISGVRSVHGFSSSEIFAAGSKYGPGPTSNDSSLIIHYDGTQWSEFDVSGAGGRILLTIWGIAPDDIWAGGIYGTLFHYNGSTWESVAMPDSIWIRSFAGFSYDDVYALAYNISGRINRYFLHWDGRTWTIEDQFVDGVEDDRSGIYNLKVVDGEFYSFGRGVFKWDPAIREWERIKQWGAMAINCCGNRSDNMFVVGVGSIHYYDGFDWYRYDEPERAYTYYDCWTDGSEVFVVGNDMGLKSFILHGK